MDLALSFLFGIWDHLPLPCTSSEFPFLFNKYHWQHQLCLHNLHLGPNLHGHVAQVWHLHSHAYCYTEQPFCLQFNCFSPVPETNLLRSAHAHARAAGNNTGKKWFPLRRRETGLPFRIWQPCFKLCQIPALPSLCWNVSFSTEEFYCPTFPLLWWHWGTKTSADPMGASAGLTTYRCTLWLWHNFAVRRHKSLCRGVFVSRDKAWKREKKTIQMPSLKWLSLPPFIMQVGVSFVRMWW